MTDAAWVDAKLRTLQRAGDQMLIEPGFAVDVYWSLDEAEYALRQHHSFRVHVMLDGSILLTKRACISRNRWL